MGQLQRANTVVIPSVKPANWTADLSFPSIPRIRDEWENVIADCRTIDGPSPKVDRQQDARGRAVRIVRAVNSHAPLVAALRATVEALEEIRDGNRGQGLIAQHGDALDAALTVLAEVDHA